MRKKIKVVTHYYGMDFKNTKPKPLMINKSDLISSDRHNPIKSTIQYIKFWIALLVQLEKYST